MKKTFLIISMLVAFSMAGTMKDSRDGKTYKTVKIGDQVWMAENLNYKTGESKCYDNKESNCKKYGRLYTWEAAKMACPSGWHLPSEDEFGTLLATVGASDKERSENLRVRSWEKGSNKFGFSALPAGLYNSYYEEFSSLGYGTLFWSSTEDNSSRAYYLGIGGSGANVYYGGKGYGVSGRCLQDSNEGGEASSQRSEAQPPSGTLKDSRDGKTYKTVKIGKQTWMAENLNYPIGKSKCYENEPENCEEYGRLYTWDDAKKACPNGWHLPSKEEMESFVEEVKVRIEQTVTQKKLDAVPLREGEGEWYNHLRDASWREGFDSFGFSALPAGSYNSRNKEFHSLGNITLFWSSTEYDSDYAYYLDIPRRPRVRRSYDKNHGHSVRCLQDSN